MTDILKHIDAILEQEEVDVDQEVFDMFINFITSLDPEQLTEKQEDSLLGLMEYLDPEIDMDDEEQIDEVRYLRRTTRAQKRKAKLYRRRHKAQIRQWRRRQKVKLRRSRITGRGLSGRRLGRTKRRPAPST